MIPTYEAVIVDMLGELPSAERRDALGRAIDWSVHMMWSLREDVTRLLDAGEHIESPLVIDRQIDARAWETLTAKLSDAWLAVAYIA